jgi:hypothetical protein
MPGESAVQPERLPLAPTGMAARPPGNPSVVPPPSDPQAPCPVAGPVRKQVSSNTVPDLISLVHGKCLGGVMREPAGVGQMPVGGALQRLAGQPQLDSPRLGVVLSAVDAGPVGVHAGAGVALECSFELPHDPAG